MKKMLAILFCFILVFTCASAHPGRTDANGGHWDHSTGEYHSHHGYEAHQHPDGICPYDYDDQTGTNSGTSSNNVTASADTESASSQSMPYDPSEAPVGYPEAVNYDVVTGSKLIDRTYFFDENGFMYTPFPYDNIPHGAVETDNSMYLQYDSITLNQVVYQYGLENQSEQFQQGAMFGIHEASLYYDYWYDTGYSDGQKSDETASSEEYPYDRDDGTYETAYNAGYTRGCSLLIELHSDMLPDVSVLTGKLSKSNRLEGSTSLEDHGATFESAYEDGYYQSETDLFNALNELILQSDSEKQQPAPVHNTSRTIFVAILVFVILIAAALIYIVYRCMRKQVDELRSKLEKQNKFMDQVLEIKREKPYHTPTIEELRDILRKL